VGVGGVEEDGAGKDAGANEGRRQGRVAAMRCGECEK
jgi:hypothetical protein